MHERLLQCVPQLPGRDVSIFRDLELDGKDALWDVLQERASHCRVLGLSSIPEVAFGRTPAERSCNGFESRRSGGIRPGHAVRIVRVVKTLTTTLSYRHLQPAERRRQRTSVFVCRFANEPLSWQMVDAILEASVWSPLHEFELASQQLQSAVFAAINPAPHLPGFFSGDSRTGRCRFEWRKPLRQLRSESRRKSTREIRSHLLPDLGEIKFEELTPALAPAIVKKKAEHGGGAPVLNQLRGYSRGRKADTASDQDHPAAVPHRDYDVLERSWSVRATVPRPAFWQWPKGEPLAAKRGHLLPVEDSAGPVRR